MINITICRNDTNCVIRYEVEGHDILSSCLAVSVITQFPLIGAERVLKLPVKYDKDENKGFLSVQFLQPYNEELEVLLKTMQICLKMLRDKGAAINIRNIKGTKQNGKNKI